MRVFRNCDRRWPFLWESSNQPAGRWNGAGEGPVQYLADTPDGAWAEFLRHEGITEPDDLAGISRALWVIDVDVSAGLAEPDLPHETVTGGPDSYPACQGEARRLRDGRAQGLRVVSAALKPGTAGGNRVEVGFRKAPPADGQVIVLFGRRPQAVGWQVVDSGRPPADLLARVRPL